MMHVADQELVSRLLDEHGARLVLYMQQWCEWPEDVVQEAFIRLVQQRPVPENVVGGCTAWFGMERSVICDRTFVDPSMKRRLARWR